MTLHESTNLIKHFNICVWTGAATSEWSGTTVTARCNTITSECHLSYHASQHTSAADAAASLYGYQHRGIHLSSLPEEEDKEEKEEEER